MAATTGPILAVGAITMANQVVLNRQPVDWRVPIATGLAAAGFALLEKASARTATMLAWSAVVVVLLVPIDPRTPAPLESIANWWEGGK